MACLQALAAAPAAAAGPISSPTRFAIRAQALQRPSMSIPLAGNALSPAVFHQGVRGAGLGVARAPAPRARRSLNTCAVLSSGKAKMVESEDGYNAVLESNGDKVFVADWMASWCRKCTYLKPKYEKLSMEFPGMEFVCIDVNKVPQAVVKGAGVTNMPTLQVWSGGKPVESFEAGGDALKMIAKLRGFIKDHAGADE